MYNENIFGVSTRYITVRRGCRYCLFAKILAFWICSFWNEPSLVPVSFSEIERAVRLEITGNLNMHLFLVPSNNVSIAFWFKRVPVKLTGTWDFFGDERIGSASYIFNLDLLVALQLNSGGRYDLFTPSLDTIKNNVSFHTRFRMRLLTNNKTILVIFKHRHINFRHKSCRAIPSYIRCLFQFINVNTGIHFHFGAKLMLFSKPCRQINL